MTCRTIVAACKFADESPRRGFDLTNFCARFWAAGTIFPAGSVVRPRPFAAGGEKGASGYQYRTTLGGQSGEKEPSFKSGAASYRDGSITWIREDISEDSLEKTITDAGDVTWSAESPMTVTSAALLNTGGAVAINALHNGGTPSDTHRVIAHVEFSDGSEEDFAIDWEIRAAS